MDRPRITTQTLALLAVLLAEPTTERYGFELAERAHLKSGTLYPLLARLERAGWLDSHWEDADPREVGRPRRRMYTLTGAGATQARAEMDEHIARLTQPLPRRLRNGLVSRGGLA